MPILVLPSLGAITLNLTDYLIANPALIHEVAGHALAHALYSHMRRSVRGRSRRVLRKEMNQRRRWFVDNIIMHHKRLHDRNRELIVNSARQRVSSKRLQQKREPISLTPESRKNEDNRWQEMSKIKERSNAIRGRLDARRLRARSRWLSVIEQTHKTDN